MLQANCLKLLWSLVFSPWTHQQLTRWARWHSPLMRNALQQWAFPSHLGNIDEMHDDQIEIKIDTIMHVLHYQILEFALDSRLTVMKWRIISFILLLAGSRCEWYTTHRILWPTFRRRLLCCVGYRNSAKNDVCILTHRKTSRKIILFNFWDLSRWIYQGYIQRKLLRRLFNWELSPPFPTEAGNR